MSFWKSALGGMIGLSLGGPIGALIGAAIGYKIGNQDQQVSFSSQEQQQAAFFTALFACLAKLAKSDGRVSEEEVIKVDHFIKEKFKFDKEQRVFAIKTFNHAKDDSVPYREYASQLSSLLSNNKNALVFFYELLFELAMADHVLAKEEEDLLQETVAIFGIDPNLYNSLKKRFSSENRDPYKILGVDREMSFSEIKKVYQRKRREFHPDTLISKGLPEELLERAKERFIEIQTAFEEIEKKN